MALKTILVPVEPTPLGRTTLAVAFGVARQAAAHVVGLYLEPPLLERAAHHMAHATVGLRSADMQRLVDDGRREESAHAEHLFDQLAGEAGARRLAAPEAAAGLTAHFLSASGDVDLIAAHGRIFDLVVLSQPRHDPDHHLRELLRGVLFESGRPVLAVPETPPETVGQRVLIAWNRSALSARAAALARHFFADAAATAVLSVVTQTAARPGPGAQDLARQLGWSGAGAEVMEVAQGRHRLGDVILSEAASFGADLLVMGAYAHSPFRESLTRGVTNHILSHADIPVMMTT